MMRERHYSLFDWLWIAGLTLAGIAALFVLAYWMLARVL